MCEREGPREEGEKREPPGGWLYDICCIVVE